jgi:hypothetical protein
VYSIAEIMAAEDSDEEMYDYTPANCTKASVSEIN